SKSLGNTLTIKELVRRHDPEALRLYLLGTHYRNPLEFADERITEAGRALARLRSLKDEAERIAGRGTPAPGPDGGLFEQVAAHRARFEAAMDDDFNTPQALGALFDLARVLHTVREQVAQGTLGAGAFLLGVGELVVLAQVLGLLEGTGRRPASLDPQVKARIESLVYLRQEPGPGAAPGRRPTRGGGRHPGGGPGAGATRAFGPGQAAGGEDLLPDARSVERHGR